MNALELGVAMAEGIDAPAVPLPFARPPRVTAAPSATLAWVDSTASLEAYTTDWQGTFWHSLGTYIVEVRTK